VLPTGDDEYLDVGFFDSFYLILIKSYVGSTISKIWRLVIHVYITLT